MLPLAQGKPPGGFADSNQGVCVWGERLEDTLDCPLLAAAPPSVRFIWLRGERESNLPHPQIYFQSGLPALTEGWLFRIVPFGRDPEFRCS